MQEEKQKQYNPVIDILRIISILAVVIIHTTTRTLEASSYDLTRVPWTLFLNQAARFAVPMFFMISGFVLELNYPFHASYLSFVKKRLGKIFMPYVFWSFVYYFFVYKQHSIHFISALIMGNASYQLYFIPTLLIFYFLFPFLHKYYHVIAQKRVLISLGILQILLLYFDYRIHPLPLNFPGSIAFLNFYVFILGAVASHHKDKLMLVMKKWKIIIFLLTVGFGNYIFFEARNLYFKTHNYLSFYSQWRPSVLLYTILLAYSIYYLFNNKKLVSIPVIKTLSRLSFFVFFVHVIVLEILWYTIALGIFKKSQMHIAEQVWYDPLFFFLVASFSFLIAYLAHKIPMLSRLSG